jgi:uncharacterized membrane protein YkgB
VAKSGLLLTKDLDHHLIGASMVLIFLAFGCQKWFAYEAQILIPYISNGPLIFWLYPVFGLRGTSWFLGVSEWTFGALLFLGFWNKQLGILGAIGSTLTFLGTVTIIPFMPDGWDPVAGGFPAMTGNVPFLMKDVVLLAASFYLLKQDVARSMATAEGSGRADYLTRTLAKALAPFDLHSENLEYNVLRASMVLIFAFFGYTKWHQYAAELMVPFISHSPFIFWLYPLSACVGGPILERIRMDNPCAALCGILGQALWSSRVARFDDHIRNHRHDHSLHAERLGSKRRIPCDGRPCALPDEGLRSACGFDLLA